MDKSGRGCKCTIYLLVPYVLFIVVVLAIFLRKTNKQTWDHAIAESHFAYVQESSRLASKDINLAQDACV